MLIWFGLHNFMFILSTFVFHIQFIGLSKNFEPSKPALNYFHKPHVENMIILINYLLLVDLYKENWALSFILPGGKVSIGLTATTIVSQWTWSATLLQSSTVASKVSQITFTQRGGGAATAPHPLNLPLQIR